VNHHEPDNLVWVRNAASPGAPQTAQGLFADFFPGLQYASVLSVDIYGEFEASYYDDPLALAAGKPMARWPGDQRPSPGPAADRSRERQQPESRLRAAYVVWQPQGCDGRLPALHARPLELETRCGIHGGKFCSRDLARAGRERERRIGQNVAFGSPPQMPQFEENDPSTEFTP
jgi:hypothetical protein